MSQCVKKSVVSLIRSEQNVAATAWEAPDILSLDDLEQIQAEQLEREKALEPTEEEIALQKAYEEGLAKGHAEGFEKGRQEGFDKGRSEGLQQVEEQGRKQQEQFEQQAAETLTELATLVHALQNPLESQLDDSINHAIATLAIKISRQVIKSELSVHPEHIVTVVNELFQQLPMTEREVRFHLNPEDKTLLESEGQLKANGFDWILEADENISRGGCFVESHNFSADERVEQRLEQAVHKVFGEFPEEAMEIPTADDAEPMRADSEGAGREESASSAAEIEQPEVDVQPELQQPDETVQHEASVEPATEDAGSEVDTPEAQS